MKQKIQLIFASFFLVFISIFFSSCNHEDWEADDSVLTDVSHGGLGNDYVVATGEVQNVTHNSATILFSANYNYKNSLNIKPGIIFSKTKDGLAVGKPNVTKVELIDFMNSACDITLSDLESSTTYYYRAYAEADGWVDHYGEIKSFTTCINPPGEAIDLGLSVKWASCNIGTSNPEDIGISFYWGGIEAMYESHKADWHDYSLSTLINQGYIGSNNNLCPSYDAATQTWGSRWRMPTYEEFNELIDKCTWLETKKNGKKVFLVTGPNSNVIYLPCQDYWTSTYYDSGWAYFLEYDYYYDYNTHKSRYYSCTIKKMSNALSIRPVLK